MKWDILRRIRQYFLKWRVHLITKEHQRDIDLNVHSLQLLVQLVSVHDDSLLLNYRHLRGERVNITTRFRNAGQVISWLFYVAELVKKNQWLSDKDLIPGYGRWSPTVDEFLINTKSGSIAPYEFQVALKRGLYLLYDNIEELGDDLKAYYLRRLGREFSDIYAIMEGTLQVSLDNR